MPELPEVETMVRGIRPRVEGRTLARLCRCRCPCRPLPLTPGLAQINRRVAGQRVDRVRRVAKRVVLELHSGEAFAIEPRMTGLVLLVDPPTRAHLRLEWRFADEEAGSLWFWDRRGLGTVRLYASGELEAALGRGTIGPDALAMTEREWRDRCARTCRPIKVALLDQKLVAGIGNLYASEILHLARIHPADPANALRPPSVRRLSAAVQAVLARAIELEGSTLGDATYRNALNQNGRYQDHHRVYQRAGRPCPECGAPIQRIVQAQRSTFFCPRCQRAAG